jgi:excisionase family DNA binding protein
MSTTAPDCPLLNVYGAAQRLAVSEKTIRCLIRAGELPAVKVGASLRLDPDELDRWLDGKKVTQL